MREICTSGSEGGRAQTNELSLPLSFLRVSAIFLKFLPIVVSNTSGAARRMISSLQYKIYA